MGLPLTQENYLEQATWGATQEPDEELLASLKPIWFDQLPKRQ